MSDEVLRTGGPIKAGEPVRLDGEGQVVSAVSAASAVSLTEFLLARIAEDEAVAESMTFFNPLSGPPLLTARISRHNPARVLSECEAKRRIVEVALPGETDDPRTERGRILRIMAAVYADHPEYREEWP